MTIDELILILQQIKKDEGTGVIPIELAIYPQISDLIVGEDNLSDRGLIDIGDIYLRKEYSVHLNKDETVADCKDLSFRRLILGGRRFKNI